MRCQSFLVSTGIFVGRTVIDLAAGTFSPQSGIGLLRGLSEREVQGARKIEQLFVEIGIGTANERV
jgi:hypothetical protein